eukprot:1902838-Lingulodinium_polyedra.AAC.1
MERHRSQWPGLCALFCSDSTATRARAGDLFARGHQVFIECQKQGQASLFLATIPNVSLSRP